VVVHPHLHLAATTISSSRHAISAKNITPTVTAMKVSMTTRHVLHRQQQPAAAAAVLVSVC
jgi:hypothetical protein